MYEIVLMTIAHSFYNLLKKYLSCFFIQSSLFLYKFKQLTTLQTLHYNSHFHIFESKTVMNFDNVLMVE